MTIDQLLEMSADELDKLTEDQLREYFSPYLKISHPDHLENKPEPRGEKKKMVQGEFTSKTDQVNDILKQFGLSIKLKKMSK